MTTILSRSTEATEELGARVGAQLGASATVALFGELGAGKTVFVKGLARGLGVAATVTSPTFVLVAHHRGRLDLYHVDAYRLEHATPDEVREVGLPELFASEGICAVEWAELVAPWLPAERLDIRLWHEPDGRKIELVAQGPRFERLLEELRTDAPAGD